MGDTAALALIVLFGISAVMSVVAYIKANEAEQGEGRTHARLNGFFIKWSPGWHKGMEADVEALMHEVFRRGEYPDQGLRVWARKWREDLRESVQDLTDQVNQLREELKAHGHHIETIGHTDLTGHSQVAGDAGAGGAEAHHSRDGRGSHGPVVEG